MKAGLEFPRHACCLLGKAGQAARPGHKAGVEMPLPYVLVAYRLCRVLPWLLGSEELATASAFAESLIRSAGMR